MTDEELLQQALAEQADSDYNNGYKEPVIDEVK